MQKSKVSKLYHAFNPNKSQDSGRGFTHTIALKCIFGGNDE